MDFERMRQVAPIHAALGIAEALRLSADLLDIAAGNCMAGGAVEDMTTLAAGILARDPRLTRQDVVRDLERRVRDARIAAMRVDGLDDRQIEAVLALTRGFAVLSDREAVVATTGRRLREQADEWEAINE